MKSLKLPFLTLKDITDTVGIDETNFGNKFMEYLTKGGVPDGTPGAAGTPLFSYILDHRFCFLFLIEMLN